MVAASVLLTGVARLRIYVEFMSMFANVDVAPAIRPPAMVVVPDLEILNTGEPFNWKLAI